MCVFFYLAHVASTVLKPQSHPAEVSQHTGLCIAALLFFCDTRVQQCSNSLVGLCGAVFIMFPQHDKASRLAIEFLNIYILLKAYLFDISICLTLTI